MSIVETSPLTEIIEELRRELETTDRPWLGVHTLSEFGYCPRAGLQSADLDTDDAGSELPRPPALGGLPTHDLDKMEAAIVELLEQLKVPVACNIGLLMICIISYVSLGLMTLVLLPAVYYQASWLISLLQNYQALVAQRDLAYAAAQLEPDWRQLVPQPVDWWCLIRAGFVSVEKQPLVDHDLRLKGKPWRVLHRGASEYPVLRINVDENRTYMRRHGRLHNNHLARLAAYSYLLHRCERADSSWAIVLFNHSHQGIAVPIDDKAWHSFRETMHAASEQLAAQQQNPVHTPNANLAACIRCPLGKPELVQRDTRITKQGIPIAPYGTENVRGDVYHSPCGDHFRWLPPHEDNKSLGLPH